MRHEGSFAGLVQRIERLGFVIEPSTYRKLKGGGDWIKTDKGAVITWWESTGTVLIQGETVEAEDIRNALSSQNGRLLWEH